MRTKIVRSAIVVALLAGTAAVWAVSTGSASAATDDPPVLLTEAERRPFAIPGMDAMIVDGVHKHLLISVPDDGTVAVLDYNGKAVATLTAGTSVHKLLLSPDSSKLYAAVEDSQEIVEFDTARLTSTRRFALGDGYTPKALAFAGGKVWFSYRDYGNNGHFASLGLADGTVTPYEAPGIVSDPLIAGSPAAPGLLAVSAGPGITRGSVFVYDVSGASAELLARNDYYDDNLTEFRELQFSADAKQLVIGANGGLRFMSATDLSPLAVVQDYRYQGLDLTAGGGLLVSERPDAALAELKLYPAGASSASRSWDVPLSGAMYAPSISDVAWEPGGSHAFVVTTEYLGPQSLWVLTSPAATKTPALTLNGGGTVNAYGTTYSLTAHLGTTYSNRTVEIWADPWGTETNKLLKSGTVDSKGNLTVSYRLTRNTAVTAVFAGDGQYSPLKIKVNVYTRPAISTSVAGHYQVANSYYYFHKTTNPRFTTTMTAYPKRQEKVVLESYTGGKWKAWKSAMVTLDSAGKATYTLTGTHTTGVKYRMYAAYISGTSGDNVNYTTNGPYRYFTFAK